MTENVNDLAVLQSMLAAVSIPGKETGAYPVTTRSGDMPVCRPAADISPTFPMLTTKLKKPALL